MTSTDPRRQEWGTPIHLFRALHKEFSFTIDAAANARNAKLMRYWSPKDDALRQDWCGERVWCNPPFANIRPWLAKALASVMIGGCPLAVLLLPDATSSEWFDLATWGTVDFFRGRVAYDPPPGIKASTPAGGAMLVTYQPGELGPSLVFRRRDARTGLLIDPTTTTTETPCL
jgi:phage N-6-adenine-methyltransferase